jgi:hypothetical protein
MGRERGFRANVLLQPLADAVADRSRGLAIELIVIVVDSAAVHSEFPRRALEEVMQVKS